MTIPPRRRILLLQGPVGGFFAHLQTALSGHGFEVRRLVFNGGDIFYSLGGRYEVARFRDGDYQAYFERLLGEWRPDFIVLFGDERPIHRVAKAAAAARGIRVWCFEEGYIRPDHVTFEPDGNNANSTLPATFDPTRAGTPPAPAPHLTGQTFAMGLRACFYFIAHRSTRHLFPGYEHHRERSLRAEFRYWFRAYFRRRFALREDERLVEKILAGEHSPFFVVALQVHDDLQLRRHGRGWTAGTFLEAVLDSFHRAAPADARLLIKAHPFDIGHNHHRKTLRRLIELDGLTSRVVYLQSGPLLPIVRQARGVVTINSTAGLASLRNAIPTIAFGKALYHVEGLSRPPAGIEDLDRFWQDPPAVDREVADRFVEHTLRTALIPGSFYLKKTWPGIADAVAARLRAADADRADPAEVVVPDAGRVD
jgi:capsular polysaccharide export protein